MNVWLKFLDRDQTKRECGYLLSKALHLGGDFRVAELGLVRDYVSQLYYFHQRPGCDSQENGIPAQNYCDSAWWMHLKYKLCYLKLVNNRVN